MSIRYAHAAEFADLVSVEEQADALLVEYLGATAWPAGDPDRSALPGFTLVAEIGATIVGFAHVLLPSGIAHLEQLSVLPEHGRRGIGAALLEAAVAETQSRGFAELTLRTYADVPWNAPFYARHGFVLSDPESAFHRDLIAAETQLNLARYGRRVQMARVL